MYNAYTNCIKSFIDNNIETWTFKTHRDYTGILEHVTEKYGREYLIEIKNRFNLIYKEHKTYLIELCHTNDLYGKTLKSNFDNFTSCSPTNLRYILHSLLILSYMKDSMLNNVNIIEIGGGYGGLCFFLHKLAKLFDININTYSVFDLPYPLMLQKKYLEKLEINNVNYLDLDNIKNLNKNSFLISNYAFSEIAKDLQQKYTKYVLNPYTSHGFLVWNFIDTYKFIDNKDITIEKEYPLTDNNKNKYVRFRPITNA
jgi:hypothetical protein